MNILSFFLGSSAWGVAVGALYDEVVGTGVGYEPPVFFEVGTGVTFLCPDVGTAIVGDLYF